MTQKSNVVVLCGGQSTEHEVSIQSAKNVIHSLNPQRYNVLPFFVSKQGAWYLLDSVEVILSNPLMSPLPAEIPGQRLAVNLGSSNPFVLYTDPKHVIPVDVLFPILHGQHGEDGTLQGLLELLNIPYVGAGTLGSAIAMDKEITKQLLHAAGIRVAKWLVSGIGDSELDFATVLKELGLPLFVKPANTGSSVGVSKVKTEADFFQAIATATQYDTKIIVEECIVGREIECAVLGNSTASEASLPGEIISHHEFYTYAAKYLDPQGASLKLPAELPQHLIQEIQNTAKRAFRALACEGMARIDFFLTKDERLYVNEANTLPGFTDISMYPKLWQLSGLPNSALTDRLISLALERFSTTNSLLKTPIFDYN